MRSVLIIAVMAAALTLIAVSCSLNFVFLASFGRDEIERMLIGSAGAAADVMKASLPWFATLAWRGERYAFVVVSLAMFGLLTVASFAAAVGFGAEIRGTSAEARKQQNKAISRLEDKRSRAQAEIEANGKYRSRDVIEAEIQGLQQSKFWSSSKRCTDATLVQSRLLCRQYFQAMGELRSASEGRRLSLQIEELSAKIAELQRSRGGQSAEPQVAMLALLLERDNDLVRLALVLLTALVIELGSGLGLYLALHHSRAAPRCEQSLEMPVELAGEAGCRIENRNAAHLMNSVERFCLERLVPSHLAELPLKEAYDQFALWCGQNGIDRVGRRSFDTAFSELALELGLECQAGTFVGIKLASDNLMGRVDLIAKPGIDGHWRVKQ